MNEQNQPMQPGSTEPQQSTQPAVVGTPLGAAAPQTSEPTSFNTPMGTPNGAALAAAKKSKMPLIIALVVVFLAVVGVVAFLLLGKKSESPSSTQTTTTNQAETTKEPVTAESTIVTLEAKAVELHKKQSIYEYEVSQVLSNYDPTEGYVYYKPSGLDYFVRSEPQAKGAFSHSYLPRSTTDPNAYSYANTAALATQKALIEHLVDTLGFSKQSGSLVIEFPIETITYSTYKNGTVYCMVADPDMIQAIGASCASEEKVLAGAKTVAPLYAIYAKAATPTSKLYGGTEEVAGKNGYKILRLATEFNYITFVKSTAATDWKYVKPSRYQSLPNCTEFEYDTDARMAFEGTACARNNKESTVTAK